MADDNQSQAPQFDQQKAKDFAKGVSQGPDAWGNLKRALGVGDKKTPLQRRLSASADSDSSQG